MSGAEAKQLLENRKLANRRSAGTLTQTRSSGKTMSTTPKTSPDSNSTWEECEADPEKLSGKACIAVGRQLLGDIEQVGPTLQAVTQDVVFKQHELQKRSPKVAYHIGDSVCFRYGRSEARAVVQEVYPDIDGTFYLLVEDNRREIQVDESRIIGKVEKSGTSGSGKGPGATDDNLATIMAKLQETMHLMELKDTAHREEMGKMQAAVQAIARGGEPRWTHRETRVRQKPEIWFAIAKGGGQTGDVGVFGFAEAQRRLEGATNPVWRRVQSEAEGWAYIAEYQEQQLLATTRPPRIESENEVAVSSSSSSTGRWYAVAKGRNPESVGVYTSWARASVEVEGVSNACFKSFRSEKEADRFLKEYTEQREMTSLQAALFGMKHAPESGDQVKAGESNGMTLDSLSGMGGRASGPDPSQKSEGKIFGLVFTEENSLRSGLVPHPRTLAPQVQMHLLGQALDVAPLPYSVACSSTEGADSGAALSRALATMAGAQTDIELRGEPMDLNWKSGNKISLTSIKTLTQLRERLSELRQGKRAVEQTLLGRISSVLQHAGYETTVADEWALGSIIYRMGCDSQYYYIQLHEHILGQAWEDKSSCDFDNAKLD